MYLLARKKVAILFIEFPNVNKLHVLEVCDFDPSRLSTFRKLELLQSTIDEAEVT